MGRVIWAVDPRRAAVLRAARLTLDVLDASAPVVRANPTPSSLRAAEASTGRLADRHAQAVEPDIRAQLEADRAGVTGAIAAGRPHAPVLDRASADWEAMLEDLYADGGWQAGRKVWSSLTGVRLPIAPPDPETVEPGSPEASYWDKILAGLLLLAGASAGQILASSLAATDAIVAEGVAAGKSHAEIAADVAAASTWQPTRAQTIATNEADTAVNGGANAGAQAASDETGRPVFKQWVTRQDERVRLWHRGAHGQRRRVEEPFRVGPDQMMYPADDSLGAEPANIINCRCRVVYALR